MSETIVAALIAAGASIAVCTINSHYQHKREMVQQAKNTELIEYRLKQLEDKVQTHNNLIDRMYEVEKDTKLQDQELKRINKRISNLEEHARKEGEIV